MVMPRGRRTAQLGVSLIELAVTLVVLAILALVAAPFSPVWADNAAIGQAEAVLRQGKDLAKATALRNPQGKALDDSDPTAAALAIVDGQVLVCSSATCAAPGNADIWHADLPPSVTVAFSGGDSTSLVRYDNRGEALNFSGAPHYQVSRNSGDTASGSLY